MAVKQINEADVEDCFVECIELLGGKCLKLRDDKRNGYPDRTVLLEATPDLRVEFKNPRGGRLSPGQRQYIGELESMGREVFVTDNLVDALIYVLEHYVGEEMKDDFDRYCAHNRSHQDCDCEFCDVRARVEDFVREWNLSWKVSF